MFYIAKQYKLNKNQKYYLADEKRKCDRKDAPYFKVRTMPLISNRTIPLKCQSKINFLIILESVPGIALIIYFVLLQMHLSLLFLCSTPSIAYRPYTEK